MRREVELTRLMTVAAKVAAQTHIFALEGREWTQDETNQGFRWSELSPDSWGEIATMHGFETDGMQVELLNLDAGFEIGLHKHDKSLGVIVPVTPPSVYHGTILHLSMSDRLGAYSVSLQNGHVFPIPRGAYHGLRVPPNCSTGYILSMQVGPTDGDTHWLENTSAATE